MPKFKKGDKVTYHRDESAVVMGLSLTVKAVVDMVTLSDGVAEYDEPLYHISWPPTGIASVRESQLS